MKYLFTIIIIDLFIIIAHAQDVTHQVKDKVCRVYKNPSRASEIVKELEPKSWVGVKRTKDEFYEISEGFLHKDDIFLSYHDYKIDSIRSKAIELESIEMQNKLDTMKFYLDLYKKSLGKNKLYISHYFNEEYSSADFTFNIISSYTKKIKYVTIYAQPYNQVDDKIGKPLMFKAIGPISGDKEINTYTFENAMYSNVLSYVSITKVVVQFMDNTLITIGKKDVTFTDKTLKIVEKLGSLKYE